VGIEEQRALRLGWLRRHDGMTAPTFSLPTSPTGFAPPRPPSRHSPAKPPPELSPAQETALFNTLRAVLRAPPPYPGPGAQPSGAAATALEAARALAKAEAGVSRTSKPHPGVLGVLSAKYGVVRTANNAALVNDNGQPQGELIQLLSYLENDALRVGVDVVRGGVVGHISSPNMPVAFRGRSLINSYDCGRMLQQSYYGCDDGSCWAARPWRWNPVQCGSWENLPARLVEASVGEGRVRTSAVPRNWGNQELIEDVLLTSDYSLRPDALAVNFTMRYTGDTDHPLREQELPAVFADRRLSVLASYTGATPWAAQGTDDLTLAMPGGVNEPFKPTEHWVSLGACWRRPRARRRATCCLLPHDAWACSFTRSEDEPPQTLRPPFHRPRPRPSLPPKAAYVEPDTGYGIGVFTPIASGLTAYRVGPNNSTRVSDVSYFALTSKYPIPANSTVSYRAYVAVGRLDEIRAT
jgi:hypothetical protein